MKIKELWRYKHNSSVLGLKQGDINKNRKKEIFAYTKTGEILIFSLDGKKLLEQEISPNFPIWNAEICDFNKDNSKRIILGGMDGLLRCFKCSKSYNLNLIWTHKFAASISGILIGDINSDNKSEIIAFSLDKTLRILNLDKGLLIWGQTFEDGIEAATIWTDISKINKKEIIACGNDGTLRSFNGNDGNLIWFKRYSDKVRCVAHLKSKKGNFIICGGDDKKIHIINKLDYREINTIQFENYVWKCKAFPNNINNIVLISTYSFAHFSNILLKNVKFTSKLVCIDEKLNIKWELENKNVESMNAINANDKNYLLIGTTKGDLLLLEKEKGEILNFIETGSTINQIEYEPNKNIIFTCHDNGYILTFSLKDFELR